MRGSALALVGLAVLGGWPSALAASGDGATPRVEAFSPRSYSKDVRQVSARFSAPMVRLGDAERPSPFRVRCGVPGNGRWLDEYTWVYDFEYDVPGAMRCRFTLRRGARTVAGRRLGGDRRFTFDTGGPSIRFHLPEGFHRADERQVFVLGLDARARPESVAAHAACLHDDGRKRANVELVEGPMRQKVLTALEQHRPYDFRRLMDAVGKHLPAAKASAPHGKARRERALRRMVLVRCQAVLAPGRMTLVWGAGIAGANGRASPTDQHIEVYVRDPFRAERTCVAAFGGCLPLKLGVRFWTPIPTSAVEALQLVAPNGSTQSATLDHVYAPLDVEFPGPFLEDAEYRIALSAPIADIDGRPLANADAFPLVVRTGRLPPGASFFGDLTVVEAGGDPAVPVLVRRAPAERLLGKRRRVDDDAQILTVLRRIAADALPTDHSDANGRRHRRHAGPWNWPSAPQPLVTAEPGAETFELAVDESVPYSLHAVPAQRGFNLIDLALPRSPRVGGYDHVVAGALVTDMALHFHRSRESSLVWVTSLADAQPVAGASVQITNPCTGTALWRGATDVQGIARVPIALPKSGDCHPFYDAYLVGARTDDDASFVITGWDGGRRSRWASNLTVPRTRLHAVFDRSLYMPGQRVDMKLVARLPTSAGLAIPEELPATAELMIEHADSGKVYTQDIEVDARGSALASFDLPESAKLGWYDVAMRLHGLVWNANAFRVERFRVGTMLGRIELPAGPLVKPAAVPLSFSVSYLGGGPAARLPISVRTEIDHWGSVLGNARQEYEAVETALVLDDDGTARLDVDDLPPLGHGATLHAEMDYVDANGETTTEAGWVDLLPAAVELDAQGVVDAASGQQQVRITVRNLDGTAASGRRAEADLHTHRFGAAPTPMRLPGGFRAIRYSHEPRRIGTCSATADADGVVACPVPAETGSRIIVSVRVADAAGNIRVWDDSVYLPLRKTDEMALEVLASTPRGGEAMFLPGDIARIEARLPFDHAVALVTVQREGILDAFATTLEGPSTILSVPVRAAYAPNVEVSVLAVRGRMGPAPTIAATDAATLVDRNGAPVLPTDPNGPEWRHSTTDLRVDTRHRKLDVRVATDRGSYSVRDKVAARITVEQPGGGPVESGEVAVAVLDEGLLERWPNWSWRILPAVMDWRAADVETTSMLAALHRPVDYPPPPRAEEGDGVEEVVVTGSYIRRESFDLPAVDANGAVPDAGLEGVGDGLRRLAQPGGDRPLLRKDFDSLVLWQGRLPLDENGAAEVAFPLNDLLTSFRIVAVATAGADLFGTGETVIHTTQDLVLHSGLPPTVRRGDRLKATFTVRNATDRELPVEVTASLKGHGELEPRQLLLAPGAARELVWQVSVPDAAAELEWRIDAEAGAARDSLAVRQSVLPLVPVEVQQATVRQLAAPLELPVRAPARAIPGRGGVRVAVRASLGVGLESVRAYMDRYPYSCIEQQVSAAVVHGDAQRWDAVMANARQALGPDGLLRYFPREELIGSPILTAYVLTIADAAGKTIPEDMRTAMLAGLQRHLAAAAEDAGRASPPRRIVHERGSAWLWSLPLRAALARFGSLAPELPEADRNLALLPTSALLDWIDILARTAPQHPDRAEAKRILRSRLNLQGTTMGVSTEDWDRLWWQMVSNDGNAARLLLLALNEPDWQPEVARMMQGLMGRQRRGRWDTTVANAWGTVATQRFQTEFESRAVDGVTVVRLGAHEEHMAWRATKDPEPAFLPWSAGETLALRHEGHGSPWSLVALEAAIPTRRAVQRGYRLDRTVRPVRRDGRVWRRGDVAQIDLAIDAASDMTWVVVEDPIPPGATILGSGLGGDSAMLAARDPAFGHQRPAFVEGTFSTYRAYYEHVPKGQLRVQYRVRYNAAGRFNLPPTRVEAMYAPEMHAELPLKPVTVK